VILEWPVPRSVHVLCAFLGLAGYYRCFIQDYDTITMLLTGLLRKGAFWW
jgi:hypothetical protein